MQFNIRHAPFYNFLTILRSSARVSFFYRSGPCTVPAKFFLAFLLISFVSASFYFKERYVTLYLYYICRVFRLAQPDALFSQAAAPAARRRMSAVFRSASADHVKNFHRTARFNALRPAVPQIIRRRFCQIERSVHFVPHCKSDLFRPAALCLFPDAPR